MNQLLQLPKPFLILAPMDDVTDTVFRQIIADCAKPDLFFTEFVSVDGLQSEGRSELIKKLRFTNKDTPLIAQLWGKKPENFYSIAGQLANGYIASEFDLAANVNYFGIDLNMGCPVKAVVKNGACSALMNNRELAAEIIESTKNGSNGKLPVSVKTRLGFNQIDFSWIEFLLNQKLAMLTIHARTRSEMSKTEAHWECFEEIIKLRDRISPETLIVGNGDVKNYDQAQSLAKTYKLDGIMIGRGALTDPFVFDKNSQWEELKPQQRIELYAKHIKKFDDTWQGNKSAHLMKKFCKLYINNFDGASNLRELIMKADTLNELLASLEHLRTSA